VAAPSITSGRCRPVIWPTRTLSRAKQADVPRALLDLSSDRLPGSAGSQSRRGRPSTRAPSTRTAGKAEGAVPSGPPQQRRASSVRPIAATSLEFFACDHAFGRRRLQRAVEDRRVVPCG
jgi:hypothetical protein